LTSKEKSTSHFKLPVIDTLKIALVQADTRYDSISGNLAHLEELIEKSGAEADIFLLPELFNTGYVNAFSMRPESMGLETSRWMKQMAIRKKAAFVGSIAILDGGKVYNRMLMIDPQGGSQHYDKINVFKYSGEDKVFSAGENAVRFHYQGWNIKPCICFDIRFPETIRNEKPFYDLILCSAHWPAPRIEAWDKLLIARAIENQAFLAAVNRIGTEGEAQYPGHSVGIDYAGKVLNSTAEKEEVMVVSFDKNAQNSFREKLPFLPEA
jgi:predicted amidohydrolase